MIPLLMKASLFLLCLPELVAKTTDISPSNENLSLPALLGLQSNQYQLESKQSGQSLDNIQDTRDGASRIMSALLSRTHSRRELERMLQTVLSDISRREIPERKAADKKSHACRINLGSHCLTEEMDSLADTYHYLMSSNSPGRKRRAVKV
ncbi:hypothetical protein Bpfe_002036 [Biomphalaria pfeifferi]|uniref:Uncharacterized protein n=1 Tax=Biomphalaria pfeifferi TaxID=112525 RepID=A0AAD8C801_BIOPF|nr:hypothetical protein Bpfe_002036 [Biomphalaria pfeifferi]